MIEFLPGGDGTVDGFPDDDMRGSRRCRAHALDTGSLDAPIAIAVAVATPEPARILAGLSLDPRPDCRWCHVGVGTSPPPSGPVGGCGFPPSPDGTHTQP
jgi:hypothetical protein